MVWIPLEGGKREREREREREGEGERVYVHSLQVEGRVSVHKVSLCNTYPMSDCSGNTSVPFVLPIKHSEF